MRTVEGFKIGQQAAHIIACQACGLGIDGKARTVPCQIAAHQQGRQALILLPLKVAQHIVHGPRALRGLQCQGPLAVQGLKRVPFPLLRHLLHQRRLHIVHTPVRLRQLAPCLFHPLVQCIDLVITHAPSHALAQNIDTVRHVSSSSRSARLLPARPAPAYFSECPHQ